MGKRIRKIKNIRLHHEGNETLMVMGASLAIFNAALYWLCRDCCIWLFYSVAGVSVLLYSIIVNFFRCPLRHYEGDTERTVVASADGKVVVIEEVDENEYFHDRRLMISIFMSVTNVHANWFPVEGVVKMVRHHNGNFYKAWLPKAST